MDSEHQPLAASSTTELYSQETPPAADPAFSHETLDVTGSGQAKDGRPWYIPPKRYIISLMAFLGFDFGVVLVFILEAFPQNQETADEADLETDMFE